MEHASQSNGDRPANADYLILSCLNKHDGETSYDKLKTTVCDVVDQLNEKNVQSPINYVPTNGPADVYSRSLIRTISRCADSQSITETENGIQLTTSGKNFLEEIDEFPVSEEFIETVNICLGNDLNTENAS